MKKKKEGLPRLLEIAGQKKGLLLLAGLLSVGSAMCMLVPYWAVYEVLKELLLHGSNPVLANGTEMIRWGWIALGGLVGGLVLLYAALMSSHVAAFRILYGLRISLLFGLALTVCSAVIGIMVGAVQGYYGGWIDLIGQRILEVWGGLPMLFIVMILVSMFSPSVYWLFLIMLLFGWTELVGLVRAEFLRARNFDYVRAAQALGVRDHQIIFKHILPNAMSSSLSQIPFMLTANIIALTALDFLGYGLPPDAASLGELLLQGKNNLDSPWLVLSGFFTLAIVLSLLIYIGEAARDAFDPRR